MSTSLSALAVPVSGTRTNEWAPRALDSLARLLGEWVRDEAFAGRSWGRVLLAIATLLIIVLAAHTLQLILRRVARKQGTKAETATGQEETRASWIKLSLEALIPPLTLFLWIWGLFAACNWLVIRPGTGQASTLFRVLEWCRNAGEIGALFWFFFRMIRVVAVRLNRWADKTDSKWDNVLVALIIRALRFIVPLVGIILVMPTLDLSFASHELFKQAASLVLIGVIGFISYQLVAAVEAAVLEQFDVTVRDNLEARKVCTQVQVLKKIAVMIIVIFTAACMLMVFESVRQLGTSILASAGVVGIIVGFAAQKSIATLLAGVQIALTQPIRIDDVVIVENEWGRIEEITLTYVVVKIWDLRRLVVPINYFIEKPFQNWTRVSADLLGSVFLNVDYTVPLKALREELDRILENTTRWDKRVKVIQVTDSKPDCMEVRVLVSAVDASTAWELRCEVREKLIDFLQRNYPNCLPQKRAQLLNFGDVLSQAKT